MQGFMVEKKHLKDTVINGQLLMVSPLLKELKAWFLFASALTMFLVHLV